MTDQSTMDALRAALDATLAELAESPLPGARYAYTVVKDRIGAALADSATDEGPGGLTALEQREIAEVLAAADKMPLLNRFFATLHGSSVAEDDRD